LIDGLERNRAFVPDRITANIIVRCWIRCGLGIYNPTGPGAVPRYHRVPSLTGGKWAWKKPTIAVFGPAELRSVFEVTSSAMKRHATLGEAWDGDKLEYERHIRPFCKMIIRAAKVLGDYEVYGRAVRMRIEGKAFGVRGVWTRYEEIVRTGGQLGRSDEDEREDEDEGGDGDGDEEQLGRRAAGRA